MEKVLRSKGAAKEPTKVVITGANVIRCNFESEIGQLLLTDSRVECVIFLDRLSCSKNLREQISCIQQFKGHFLKNISSIPIHSDVIQEIRILAMLYLHPDYALLRKSLEWIIETLCTNQVDSVSVRKALRDVTLELIETSRTAGILLDQKIEIATSWAVTFTIITMVDKEYPFLGHYAKLADEFESNPFYHGNEVLQLDDSSLLLEFLEILDQVFGKFTKIVLAQDTDTSAEVMRYADCCGECMRAMMTSLKSRRGVYITNDGADRWMKLVNSTIKNGCAILNSELVHKDTVTATAMSVVCLQWIARYRLSQNSTVEMSPQHVVTPSSQLSSILDLLRLSPSITSPLPNELRENFNEAVAGVHADLYRNLPSLPIMSQSAILRACMTVFDDDTLLSCSNSITLDPVVSNSGQQTSLLLGSLFTAVVAVCGHSLPLVRLYGLQTLESWFNCLDLIIAPTSGGTGGNGKLDSKLPFLTPTLRIISALLVSTWSHPSKQVNHMVPTVYQRLINAVHLLTEDLRVAGKESDVTAVWKPFIAEALALPAQHRARYQAMTMLIPCVGGKQIILAQPDVFFALVQAVTLRDVASSSCTVVVALLRDLTQTSSTISSDQPSATASAYAVDVMAPLRPLWTKAVASALCCGDLKMRTNSADYLVPELLKVDNTCGPHLMKEIRSVHPTQAHTHAGAGADENYGGMLWGLVQVTLHARALTLPGKAIVPKGAGGTAELSDQEVLWACLSADVDLRLAALTLLTVSQRTSAPLADAELLILRKTLKYSLKCSGADQRQRLTRIVKALVMRLSETSRMSERDLQRLGKRANVLARDLKAATAAEDGVVKEAIEAKLRQGEADIVQSRVVIKKAAEVLQWLCGVLSDNIYPGTVFEREVTALELLHCAIDSTDSMARREVFYSDSMTATLLNLLLSSWDRSRRLAADLLLKFPRPLPCYTSCAELAPLVRQGCRLAGSARQRESDAGALLLRTLFSVYSMTLGWQCSSQNGTSSSRALELFYCIPAAAEGQDLNASAPSRGLVSTASASFINSLCDLLENRLGNLESMFESFTSSAFGPTAKNATPDTDAKLDDASAEKPAPLCHGLLLAIRYCMKELQASSLLTAGSPSDSCTPDICSTVWRPLLKRVLTISLDAFRVALLVVAEAPCDVQFAPAPTAKMRGEYSLPSSTSTDPATTDLAVKGPVNSSTILTASYINTNSLMGATCGVEGEVNGEMQQESMMQRAVVAAWLLVKEAAAMLALLVDLSPAPLSLSTSPLVASTSWDLLSVEDISTVGAVILDALGRLKHMGAIAETHAALQAIAQRLFKHGERSIELCRLPYLWLRQLLDRLGSEQQVFILRRSAGFAYSFVSLLRSEPSNCKVTLLPLAMRVLLKHIERGLDDKRSPEPLSIADGEGQGLRLDEGLGPVQGLGEEGGQGQEEGSWRISVHALNVIRMILVDAALSPDLDTFIAESTQLAVRGFQSRNWAVRNSSMMVFSSVVQRAVDNDKNESGGARAATAADFFQRFPSLFLFLLTELGNITGYSIQCRSAWPDKVISNASTKASGITEEKEKEEKEDSRGSHEGGLHPSLYPILLLLSKMRPAAEESPHTVVTDAGVASRQADISLFVPLVESCRGQQSQKVREMAAKALCALIPLRAVPVRAAALLEDVNSTLAQSQSGTTRSTVLCHNSLHGTLSLCHEVLDSLKRRMAGVGDNRAIMSVLQAELDESLLLQAAHMLSLLSLSRCPSLHIVFLRIVRTACSLLSTYGSTSASSSKASCPSQKTAQALLLGECRVALGPVLGGRLKEHSLPYAPVLYREAIQDMTFYSLLHDCSMDWDSLHSEAQYNDPFGTYPVHLLLSHLSHPMSEVREGVLLGCQKALSLIGITSHSLLAPPSSSASSSSSAASSPSLFGVEDPLCTFIVHGSGLLEMLSSRIAEETEPPLRLLALQLMCSRLSDGLHGAFKARWPLLLLLATSDSISLPALQESLSKVKGRTKHKEKKEKEEEEAALASTESAAQALELMGWVIAASLTGASKEVQSEIGSDAHTLGADWARLLEDGSCEDRSSAAREATARSLAASQLLPWTHSRAIERATSVGAPTSSTGYTDGWAVIAVRVWLVIVKLMQDDDEETRGLTSNAVACLGLHIPVKGQGQGQLYLESDSDSDSPIPRHMPLVQGFMIENTGRLIAEAILRSISESTASSLTTSNSIEDLPGLQAAVRDYVAFIGSKESATAALTASGESLYSKIFEAEQANLHAEPLVAARVLGTALALCSLRLASSAPAVSDWIRTFILQQCADAVDLLQEQGASGVESEWVGGCTYQKETFTFLYGAFESTIALQRDAVSKSNAPLECDYSMLSPNQRDLVRGGTGARGGGGAKGEQEILPLYHRVVDRGHPWIQQIFPLVRHALVDSNPVPTPIPTLPTTSAPPPFV